MFYFNNNNKYSNNNNNNSTGNSNFEIIDSRGVHGACSNNSIIIIINSNSNSTIIINSNNQNSIIILIFFFLLTIIFQILVRFTKYLSKSYKTFYIHIYISPLFTITTFGCKDIHRLLFISESFFYFNNNNKYSSSNINNGTGNINLGIIDSSGVRGACGSNTGIVKVVVQIIYVISNFFYNNFVLIIIFWMVL